MKWWTIELPPQKSTLKIYQPLHCNKTRVNKKYTLFERKVWIFSGESRTLEQLESCAIFFQLMKSSWVYMWRWIHISGNTIEQRLGLTKKIGIIPTGSMEHLELIHFGHNLSHSPLKVIFLPIVEIKRSPSWSLTVRPWKMILGRRSSPFGMVYFQGLCHVKLRGGKVRELVDAQAD